MSLLIFSFSSKVNYVSDRENRTIEESAWCGVPFDQPNLSCQLLMLLSTSIFFVVPMTLILILYVRIALVLHRSSRSGSLRRCCATQHQPQHSNGAIILNGTASHHLGMPAQAHTLHAQAVLTNSGKRGQVERQHIQSRRAVIRMLGNENTKLFPKIFHTGSIARNHCFQIMNSEQSGS